MFRHLIRIASVTVKSRTRVFGVTSPYSHSFRGLCTLKKYQPKKEKRRPSYKRRNDGLDEYISRSGVLGDVKVEEGKTLSSEEIKKFKTYQVNDSEYNENLGKVVELDPNEVGEFKWKGIQKNRRRNRNVADAEEEEMETLYTLQQKEKIKTYQVNDSHYNGNHDKIVELYPKKVEVGQWKTNENETGVEKEEEETLYSLKKKKFIKAYEVDDSHHNENLNGTVKLDPKQQSETNQKTEGNREISFTLANNEKKHKITKNLRTDKNVEPPEEYNGKKYTKLGKNSRILSEAMITVMKTKVRKEENRMALEGKRLINDAISCGLKMFMLFFSKLSDLENLNIPENVPIYKALYKDIKVWSQLITPPGVLGIFEKPDPKCHKINKTSIPLNIVCDNIRDPTTAAAILRTAACVGCARLILLKGCTDVWDQKVLRGGAGAHLRIPIFETVEWGDLKSIIEEETLVCLAESTSPLNLEELENEESIKIDESEENEQELRKRKAIERKRLISDNLPLVNYCSKKYWSGKPVTLVIGGETEGLSEDAYLFADRSNGCRVYIPISNDMDSLNSGSALGILAFEVKRQYDVEVSEPEKVAVAHNEPYTGVGLYSE